MRRKGHLKISYNKKLLKNIFLSGFNIILIILILNLLSNTLIIVDTELMLVSTIFLLIGLLIFNIPFVELFYVLRRKKLNKFLFYKILIGLIFILFSFILLIFIKIDMLWFVSIPILLSGLDLTLQSIEIKRKEIYLLSVTSFIYALFYIVLQTIPFLWYLIQQFSLWFSNTIGIIIGKSLLLGPTASGLWIIIIFLIFSISIFFLSDLKKKYFIFNNLGILISWTIFLVIIGFIDFESKSEILNLHFLLFIFCLIPVLLYLLKISLNYKRREKKFLKNFRLNQTSKNRIFIALVFIIISSLILTIFPGANQLDINSKNRNILFYGQNQLGSWDVPEYGKYGRASSGMFGLLPYYLNLSGYNSQVVVNNQEEFLNITFPISENITRYVNITDYSKIIESSTITDQLLNEVGIFVVINLNTSFSEKEHESIWRFVENGGSLLVLGDHTDIGNIQMPLNNLIKPVGISYRFDSAIPIDPNFRWETCYHLFHHPITARINSLDEIDISVGASLDVNINTFPFLIGRFGLSDIGDRSNAEGAYLGDYEYNPGEQIGDIILAASAYYGNGKVIVFGDTSPFQNSAITYSLPFINSVFNWLGSQRTSFIEYTQIAISFILLILAIILYLIYRKNNFNFLIFPFALSIVLLISIAFNPIILGKEEVKGNILYIDSSHGERFDLKPFEDKSLSGLMLNFMRNDYLPLILRDFNKNNIINSRVLVFNSPTEIFKEDEVEFIKKYMFEGGLVILSTGYPDKDASMPLLKEFNLDVYDIPLGPIPYVEDEPEKYQKEPRFVNSWPIITGPENSSEIFYSIEIADETYIIMTFTNYGDGGLLFISDSEFLMDKNIESLYDYWPGNIQFLKNIIDELKTKGVLQ
jgi:hypothetical protein